MCQILESGNLSASTCPLLCAALHSRLAPMKRLDDISLLQSAIVRAKVLFSYFLFFLLL